jgi:hypothetical protein
MKMTVASGRSVRTGNEYNGGITMRRQDGLNTMVLSRRSVKTRNKDDGTVTTQRQDGY